MSRDSYHLSYTSRLGGCHGDGTGLSRNKDRARRFLKWFRLLFNPSRPPKRERVSNSFCERHNKVWCPYSRNPLGWNKIALIIHPSIVCVWKKLEFERKSTSGSEKGYALRLNGRRACELKSVYQKFIVCLIRNWLHHHRITDGHGIGCCWRSVTLWIVVIGCGLLGGTHRAGKRGIVRVWETCPQFLDWCGRRRSVIVSK